MDNNILDNRNIKKRILERLRESLEYIKETNNASEYVIRCPYCGDSHKHQDTGHFYININENDNSPIVYHCFLCDASGKLNNSVLEELGIYDMDLKPYVEKLNKTADSAAYKKYSKGSEFVHFDYTLPTVRKKSKVKYIENRLGISFTSEMLKESKVVVSLKDFLEKNNISKLTLKRKMAQLLENSYIGFLSYGSSHIIFRCVEDNPSLQRYHVYPISESSSKNKVFYTMESIVDIYTKENITINITEGIFDILSCKYNLGYDEENTINIASCGKGYVPILKHLSTIGFVGNNINVNIFADNDAIFNKNGNHNTDIKFFKKKLYNLKHLYNHVYVFYNKNSKDIGVRKEEIILEKFLI